MILKDLHAKRLASYYEALGQATRNIVRGGGVVENQTNGAYSVCDLGQRLVAGHLTESQAQSLLNFINKSQGKVTPLLADELMRYLIRHNKDGAISEVAAQMQSPRHRRLFIRHRIRVAVSDAEFNHTPPVT